MKKNYYLYLLCAFSVLLSCQQKVMAQYIGGHALTTTACPFAKDSIFLTGPDSNNYFIQYWGDGAIEQQAVVNWWLGYYGYAVLTHEYILPGTYTIKTEIANGLQILDSIVYPYNVVCNVMSAGLIYDKNNNCQYDMGEQPILMGAKIEIDSQNIPLDTISCAGGFYYMPKGPVNTIYKFRLIEFPEEFQVACPGTDVVIDTVKASGQYNPKTFNLFCANGTLHDLFAAAIPVGNGPHLQQKIVYVNNAYCQPVNGSLTIDIGDKYPTFAHAWPTPDVVTSSYVSWNLDSLESYVKPFVADYQMSIGQNAYLNFGDTVHTHVNLTPIGGDATPANNDFIIVDTVKSGFDPNEMLVSPTGAISSGTQLQYIINFENTGNDTAFNIYVMDTLSDNVDIKTMNLVTTSAKMNVYYFKAGGHNIVKFDFPGINLLDSSHHNLCDGMVMFNINAKENLPIGTTIFNHAGIFFDDNPVVMTDTVENIIGHPESVPTVSVNDVSIYPNPASTELTIKATSAGYTTLQITNMLGQQVLQQPFSGNTDKVNIQQLPAGMYYLQLKGDKNITVKKFEKL